MVKESEKRGCEGKGDAKRDCQGRWMSPVSLVHLYYCITGVPRPSCIFSLFHTGRDGYLEYPTLISSTNLSIFPHRSYDVKTLSMPIIFGLENSWLEISRFFYTFIVCARPHINRDLLNNTVIPQVSRFLKQRGTDLRNDATNFWRSALPRDCLTLAHFQILAVHSRSFLCFYPCYQPILSSDSRRGSFFSSEFLIGCILCVFEAWRWQKFR